VKLELYLHQKEALEFAINAKYSICSLDMGLGKSAVALALAESIGGHVLIVVPAFLRRNWQNEIEKFVSEEVEIEVVSYSSLNKLILADYSTIICDEAHYLKTHTTNRTKLLHEIVKATKPDYLMLLTGTPLKNRVPEFWSLLQLCYYGGSYSPFKPFFMLYYKFCNTFSNERTFEIKRVPIVRFEGVKNVERLKELIKPVLFRKRASEVLDLPESSEINVQGPKCSKQLEKDLIEAFERFEQDHKDPAYMSLKRANAVSKTATTIKLAKDMLDQGEQVVIFTDHVSSCETIAEAFKKKAITGKMKADNRALLVERFEAKKDQIIVATIGSLSTGVNLVSSNKMIFNDVPFVPADLDQAKARIRRIGQDKKCFYYYIVSSETDNKLLDMLKRKNRDISKVIK